MPTTEDNDGYVKGWKIMMVIFPHPQETYTEPLLLMLLCIRSVEVKVTQSCPTLCDPMDYTLRNSPGQNTGEAFPFSRGSSQARD